VCAGLLAFVLLPFLPRFPGELILVGDCKAGQQKPDWGSASCSRMHGGLIIGPIPRPREDTGEASSSQRADIDGAIVETQTYRTDRPSRHHETCVCGNIGRLCGSGPGKFNGFVGRKRGRVSRMLRQSAVFP
jgi:hypothetical protein